MQNDNFNECSVCCVVSQWSGCVVHGRSKSVRAIPFKVVTENLLLVVVAWVSCFKKCSALGECRTWCWCDGSVEVGGMVPFSVEILVRGKLGSVVSVNERSVWCLDSTQSWCSVLGRSNNSQQSRSKKPKIFGLLGARFSCVHE